MYYSNYDFDSLISECCTWHYWQFAPQQGISRSGIYKQHTEFELAVTPLGNLLFIYRQKRLWDKIQIEAAKEAEEKYTAAVKTAMKKRR